MKIPKIAHFYWGSKNLPFLRYLTLFSFRKYNPDWFIKLYYPKILSENLSWLSSEHKFDPLTEDYSDRLSNLNIEHIEFDMESIGWYNDLSEVIKSDLLRWYLLSTIGGLWADMDILFFKPMKDLYFSIGAAEAVISFVKDHWTVGFLLSAPNNPVFVEFNNQTRINFNPKDYQTVGSRLVFRVARDVEKLKAKFNNTKIYNISSNVVYPLHTGKVPLMYSSSDMNYLKKETIGLHWYAGRKSTSESMRSITEQSYKEQNNIICKVIRKILD